MESLPLHLLVHLATLNDDASVYAALSLSVPRLGRALIHPFGS